MVPFTPEYSVNYVVWSMASGGMHIICSWKLVECEMIDSQRGAYRQVGYSEAICLQTLLLLFKCSKH